MTLRALLEKILNTYLQEKNKPLKGNSLAECLRSGLKNVVSDDLISGSLITKRSPGQGSWATVPWIGLFDTTISVSAAKGFDIVYLFSPDMKYVYLSLNQGWTFFKKTYGKNAENNISKESKYWQNTLANRTDRMTVAPIDLTSSLSKKNAMVSGYELSNILSISYDKDNLPSNAQLLTDLKAMLFCLNEIKSRLINENDIQQSIDYILSCRSSTYSIKEIAQKIPDITLHETYLDEKSMVQTGRQVDYPALQKQNAIIGFLGEQIVLDTEKNRLKDYPDLAKKVEHISQTRGDGLGYDILSFDTYGNPIYIEVKTTTQGKKTPFYISDNELKFASQHPDNYFLYRIYNFSELVDTNDIEFFKLTGHEMENVELKPVSFLATVNGLSNRYD
ncbi:hypothetical protein Llac01_11800 [Leuconostoc lactis]|uniref:MrcB family domain-containing protein n=1 Tax=Leuconostoc lactis TaxID=1246 RepID=UPI0011419221|nr:DUF3578 domain-containing protein [Leuconostoc lactis]GEB40975.1 hypothetical protein LLA04_13630 [Leuconostoc lactis]GLY45803.1 hypothetical protein Llac01_11800 [Leuconostoc lactis]